VARAFDHVAVGEGEVLRAPAPRDVGFEGAARGVEAVGEQLDGEVVLGPVAVDLVAVAVDVRARCGQAVRAQQLQEGVLERAERDVGASGAP